MGYRELPVPPPRRQIKLDEYAYDIDYFGMDDGRLEEPGDVFRFLFQVGAALLTRVYVIQPHGFYHAVWDRDCAAASYAEPEEDGPPTFVQVDSCPLPLLYETVTLKEDRELRLQLERQEFSANGIEDLRMLFGCAGGVRLEWTRRNGWQLTERGSTRRLAPEARPIFDPPARP